MDCSARTIKYDVRPHMRDGTELSCDVYVADDNEKLPLILLRTPYGKGSDQIQDTALKFNSKGFHFVACDVRGRGDSDGKFEPYFNEASDGYDLITWCSSLDISDGNVFSYGASYSARIQWLTALAHPPNLKGMISIVSPSDPFVEDPTGYPSPMTIQWLYSISGRTMQNGRLIPWENVFKELPLISLPDLTGRKIPFWRKYFENEPSSKFWSPLYYQTRFSSLDIPVLHISGWYDDEQIGTFINYTGMRKKAKSEFSKENQSMIIGPWPHNVNSSTKLGRLDFGKDSVIDLISLEAEWLRTVLESRALERGRVKLFIMGLNRWVDFPDWPIESSSEMSFYLRSGGRANSSSGDGLLSAIKSYQKGIDSDFDEYIYDPLDPVPFITEQSFAQIGGPDDYSEIEKRSDILVYTSDSLSKSLLIVGNIRAELYVSTSAPDTDFTAKLLDLWPENFAQRLNDGIVRLRYRSGFEREEEVKPEEIIKISVDLWNNGVRIPPGHRLRIEISSSAFPKYSRNQNISGRQAITKNLQSAVQRVYHGSLYPSRIILNVIEDPDR